MSESNMIKKEEFEIKSGDFFDIGQTVNGVSRFIWIGDNWHYFNRSITRIYEYDQEDLSKAVLNKDGTEEIVYLGNIFDHV